MTIYKESRKKILMYFSIMLVGLVVIGMILQTLIDCKMYCDNNLVIYYAMLFLISSAFLLTLIFSIRLLIKFIKPCKIIFDYDVLRATGLKKEMPYCDIENIETFNLSKLLNLENVSLYTQLVSTIVTTLGGGVQVYLNRKFQQNVTASVEPNLSDYGTLVIYDKKGNGYFLPFDFSLSEYSLLDIKKELI